MFEWIRGVINKMIKKDGIEKILNIQVAMSPEMGEAIRLWMNIYTNNASWLNRDVKSLDLAASICSEFATLVTLEFKSEITGSKRADFLQEQYKVILENLANHIELECAGGGIIYKPYVSNNKIITDVVRADCFFPTEFDSNGQCTGGIFIAQKTKEDNIYTKLEIHNYNCVKQSHTIENRAYISQTRGEIGRQINLKESIPEWAKLDIKTVILNVKRPLFAYSKIPLANNTDPNSPLGVSVFARAVNQIQDADEQYGRTMWEYEGSEKAIYADVRSLRTKKNGDNKTNWFMPRLKQRLFKNVSVEKEDFFHDYSPEVRDEAFWRGLNKIKQEIEFKSRLAYGTLSDPQYISKTATEVKSSKQRSFAVVKKIQESSQNALEHLIYIYDVLATLYELAPQGNYETSFSWKDSILTDEDTERQVTMIEVDKGLESKKRYLMKTKGMTEKQALELLDEIEKEKGKDMSVFGFEGGG